MLNQWCCRPHLQKRRARLEAEGCGRRDDGGTQCKGGICVFKAYLPVIAGSDEQGRRQDCDAVGQVCSGVGSGKCPADIGCRISHMSTHTAPPHTLLLLHRASVVGVGAGWGNGGTQASFVGNCICHVSAYRHHQTRIHIVAAALGLSAQEVLARRASAHIDGILHSHTHCCCCTGAATVMAALGQTDDTKHSRIACTIR